jgi:hypothetical protein
VTIFGFIRADAKLGCLSVDIDFFLSSMTTFDLCFDFDKDGLVVEHVDLEFYR